MLHSRTYREIPVDVCLKVQRRFSLLFRKQMNVKVLAEIQDDAGRY